MMPRPTGTGSPGEPSATATRDFTLPLTDARSCSDACDRVLDHVALHFAADRGVLFQLDVSARVMIRTRVQGVTRHGSGRLDLAPGEGIPIAGNHGAAARAIHTQHCQIVSREEASEGGFGQGLAIPLAAWSQPIGVIVLQWDGVADVPPEDAEAVRRSLGAYLERTCLRLIPGEGIARLLEATRALGAARGRPRVLRACLESALAIAGAPSGILLGLEPDGVLLTGVVSEGLDVSFEGLKFQVTEPSNVIAATFVDRRCYSGLADRGGMPIPAGLPASLAAGGLTTLPLVGTSRLEGVVVLQGRVGPETLVALRVFASHAGAALDPANWSTLAPVEGDSRRFRDFVEHSPDGCVESTLDGRILYFNDAIPRILRCTPEELLSRNARSWYVDPQQRDELVRIYDGGGTVEGMDLSVRGGDGSIVHLSVTGQAGVTNGMPVMRSIVRDVTARYEAEKRLRLLANAVTCSADAILTLDASCRIISWNKGAETIFGYADDEVLGTAYSRLVPPDLMDEFLHVIRVRAEKVGNVAGYETWRLRKDGTRVPVSITVTRTPGIGDAEWGWSVVVRDITERRREERRRRLLSSITEQSPDAILSVDREGVVTSWNLGAEKMFALPASQILGQSWLTLAPGDRKEEFESVLGACRPGEGASLDTFALRRDGRKLPVRLSASVLDVSCEGQGGWSLILRDLTEQRVLAEVSERLREELYSRNRLEGIVGDSRAMGQVREKIRRVSRFNSSVLLIGESGTGKEIVANAIHYHSPRRDKAFIKVNCAAIPEDLLESELFGIERNVATGVDGRIGRFEMADGGTLFLDEIGDMSLSTQAKILRVLQEREFERVGGKDVIKVDVRIIAATNKNLEKEIEARQFRNDLYYRLNVIVIALPPLSARREDIDPLIDHFVEKFTRENGLPRKRLALPARMLLNQYDWPGNVRELEHCIERAVVMGEGPDIVEADLPPALLIWKELGGASAESDDAPGSRSRLSDIMRQVERRTVLNALERTGWVQARAARLLGISERSMWYRVKKLGLKQG